MGGRPETCRSLQGLTTLKPQEHACKDGHCPATLTPPHSQSPLLTLRVPPYGYWGICREHYSRDNFLLARGLSGPRTTLTHREFQVFQEPLFRKAKEKQVTLIVKIFCLML